MLKGKTAIVVVLIQEIFGCHDYPNADHAFARVNGVHWDGRSAAIANGCNAEALA